MKIFIRLNHLYCSVCTVQVQVAMHCYLLVCNSAKTFFAVFVLKKQTSGQFLTIKILSCNQNKLVNLFFEAKEIDFISHFRLLFFERCKA